MIRTEYANEIRYDDPNALEKILHKRQFLIGQHDKMIQANKAYVLLKSAFSNNEILEIAQRIASNDGKPYSNEEISQNNTARKRIGQRLEILKKRMAISTKTHEFKGGLVVFNSLKNKVQIRFNITPSFELENILHLQGFRYYRRTKTWNRCLSEEAWEAAIRIVEALKFS